MQRDLVLIVVVLLVAGLACHVDGKVCHSMDVRNEVRSLVKLANCTIIKGHLRILLVDKINGNFSDYAFPELQEITEYLVFYRVAQLTSLGTLFPNLKIIRGASLFLNNYVLVIFQMYHLKECRLCGSMDLRNHPDQLKALRGCRVIEGHLKIVLIENTLDHWYFANYTFPELYEITDYLLMYRVFHLNTLKNLFPNLRIIRGQKKLFGQYTIVFHSLDQLEEIGLYNLTYIGSGRVKIDSCPNLCYADTIDWEQIGAEKLEFTQKSNNTCERCSPICKGLCWDPYHCQVFREEKCHSECLGCTKSNSPNHCISCKHFENEGTCVTSCPSTKVPHRNAVKCVLPEECPTTIHGNYWVFNNSCVNSCPPQYVENKSVTGGCFYCGENCTKFCDTRLVATRQDVSLLAGCTHIRGALEIRVTDPTLELTLEFALSRIVYIETSLVVARAKGIKSLNFLRNLRTIAGKNLGNRRYSLFVYENQDLEHLWNFTNDFNLIILNGSIGFHNNPQLCITDIEKFANITKNISKTDMDIFRISNGDKSSCNTQELNYTISDLNSVNATIKWSNWSLHSNDPEEKVIGYTVYYKDDIYGFRITFDVKEDACDSKGWSSIFVSEQKNYNVTLHSLKPYSRYGFYLKPYSSKGRGLGQTPIYYFNTSSDDPNEPTDFAAKATSNTSIKLTWKPPTVTRGQLAYYNITVMIEPDYLPLIQQRNYCIHQHSLEKLDELEIPSEVWRNESQSNCTCEETRFFHNDIIEICKNDKNRQSCYKMLYTAEHTGERDMYFTQALLSEGVDIHKRSVKKSMHINRNETYRAIQLNDPTMQSYELKHLKHFSMYIIFLTACNERQGAREQCSPVVMTAQRTKSSSYADDISIVNVEVVEDKSAVVTWDDPVQPNSLIVSYDIEHRRVDLEHSKPISDCITRDELRKNEFKYKFPELFPGKYALRVKATSIAGPGHFSPYRYFEIASQSSPIIWYIFLVALIVVTVLVTFAGYQWWKRRHALDNIHLITSVNPDYAGSNYEEDEWEMNRDDIELGRALGEGTFGTVYEGFVKSRRLYCAVKTANKGGSLTSRMEFLNEGAVMKSFSDAYHVVHLIGIVSRGDPPYVIMELMERGDLKNYLRRCRDSSQDLSTNEMYRMAVEIADGMAYLVAKKFIHRDLAARNCMVSADKTVKIGDFGMARDVYMTDYYKKGNSGFLPVRWMAPESLADGVFTSDSDVWSYGVVLWEMATFAQQPYQGMANEQVLSYVKGRGTLYRPVQCPDLLYDVMNSCWNWYPYRRPTFMTIVDRLVGHVGETFRAVSFCYSDSGQEHLVQAGPRPRNPPAHVPEGHPNFYGVFDRTEEAVRLFMGEHSKSRQRNRPDTNKQFPFVNQRLLPDPEPDSPESPQPSTSSTRTSQ